MGSHNGAMKKYPASRGFRLDDDDMELLDSIAVYQSNKSGKPVGRADALRLLIRAGARARNITIKGKK